MRVFTLLFFICSISNLHSSPPVSEVQEVCGLRPGLLPRIFTDLEEIRIKCVNDYYDRLEKERQDEIARIMEIYNQMKAELSRTAYKINFNMVYCHNPSESSQSPKALRCSEIVKAQNALLNRIDKLNGWEKKRQSSPKSEVQNKDLDLPCPSQSELNDMKAVRYFNKKILATWNRCTLNQI